MNSIFNENFWVSTVIISVIGLIVLGITLDTYLDNQNDRVTEEYTFKKMQEGFQECIFIYPNQTTTKLWSKDCGTLSKKVKVTQ